MSGQVALLKEQGQDFAVLAVKSHVVSDSQLSADMISLGEREFGVRTALLAEDGRTRGPQDIVRWLENVSVEQLPWRDFRMNN